MSSVAMRTIIISYIGMSGVSVKCTACALCMCVCMSVCVCVCASYAVYSLGQLCVLQSLISTVSPVQSSSRAPVVRHSLILLCRPPPQDRLHSVQLVQALHVFGGGEVGRSAGLLEFLSGDTSSWVSGPNWNDSGLR